jgi:beta-glucosidase/6-phospho-beta-glucosidase/beta-galactosidase
LQVKLWLTFNEPLIIMAGYSSDKGFAPAISLPGIGDYLAAHTVIYAHAMVYRLYDQLFRNKQQGTATLITKACSR